MLSEYGVRPRKSDDKHTFATCDAETNEHWYSWAEFASRDEVLGVSYRQAVARDITTHKRSETALIEARERAEAANLAKSQFLATVSHEIRTPLNGINGMAKLLADTPFTNEQRTYVQAVISSGNSLLGLIEDILDFSKIEAGKFDIEPDTIKLREFSENLIELMASRAFGKGIGIALLISPLVPERIVSDPLRLRQALLNLIGNAVKFTEKGGVVLEIAAVEQGWIDFIVRDTGPGIPLREQERIFGEFEQADAGSTRRHGGAGLGLAITRRIATAMDGTITVASRKGNGATFTLRLPLGSGEPGTSTRARLMNVQAAILMDCNVEAETLANTLVNEGGVAIRLNGIAELSSCSAAILIVDTAMAEQLLPMHLDLLEKFDEKIILIEPKDRGSLPSYRANGFASFLARPVRLETLVRVLLGRINSSEKLHLQGTGIVTSPRTSVKRLKVLLAEDNDINALLVRATLERAGHFVERVNNGRSAVQLATMENADFDVILMDLHMPEMDGMDAISAIRAAEEEKSSRSLPILALTADGQAETEVAVRGIGAHGFITKPVDPFRLLSIIEESVVE
jgi:signal transduction histidine kinase/ActR/RegA family two-component response regulator